MDAFREVQETPVIAHSDGWNLALPLPAPERVQMGRAVPGSDVVGETSVPVTSNYPCVRHLGALDDGRRPGDNRRHHRQGESDLRAIVEGLLRVVDEWRAGRLAAPRPTRHSRPERHPLVEPEETTAWSLLHRKGGTMRIRGFVRSGCAGHAGGRLDEPPRGLRPHPGGGPHRRAPRVGVRVRRGGPGARGDPGLEPLYRARTPEPPQRETAPEHLLAGPRRHADPRHLGDDIALWDLFGKVTGQPVGVLLGRRYREQVRPYASLLMQEPAALAEYLLGFKSQGFNAFKMGWGPFGRVSAAMDEAIVRAARDAVGEDTLLMVDAGGSDAFWPHGYKWAARTAEMLAEYGVYWFEEPLKPDALEDYVLLRQAAPLPIAGGEVLTRRQSFRPWIEAGAFDIVQPDVTKVVASPRSGASAGWPRSTACGSSPTAGTRRWGWPATCKWPPPSGDGPRRVHHRLAVHRRTRRRALAAGRGGDAGIPDRPRAGGDAGLGGGGRVHRRAATGGLTQRGGRRECRPPRSKAIDPSRSARSAGGGSGKPTYSMASGDSVRNSSPSRHHSPRAMGMRSASSYRRRSSSVISAGSGGSGWSTRSACAAPPPGPGPSAPADRRPARGVHVGRHPFAQFRRHQEIVHRPALPR